MKQMIIFLITFLVLLISITLTSCKEQGKGYPIDYEQLGDNERIVIRFSHVVGEDTPTGKASRKFAELVKERSHGLIEVQVFSNGMLYKDSEEMNALQSGDIQMITQAIAKLTDIIPEFSVYDLPYAFRSYEEVHNYMNSLAGQQLTRKLEDHNLISMGIWDSGFKQFSNSIRPILTFRDLVNLRMRIMPSDILFEQFVVLGAQPTRIEFNKLYNELEKNRVDGQENTLSNITSKNLHTLQDYLTISNHGYLGNYVLFNLTFWNELDSEIQLLLSDVLSEVQQWEWQVAQEMNDQHLKEIEDCQCIDVHYLSKSDIAEWEQALQPVYDYFRKKYGNYYVDALQKTPL